MSVLLTGRRHHLPLSFVMIYATCQTAAIDVSTWPTITSKKAELVFGNDSNDCRSDIGRRDDGGSGKDVNGRPTRNCPGVKASIPSSGAGRGTSGLELRHACIWARVVVSSSNVRCTSPTICLKWCLKLLTAASHSPPKCGACSGTKRQHIPFICAKIRQAVLRPLTNTKIVKLLQFPCCS